VAEEHDGYVTVATNDEKIAISLALIPGVGPSDAIVEALTFIDSSIDTALAPATPASGGDTVAFVTYDDGSSSGQLIQAYARKVGNVVFVLVLQGDLDTVGLRQVQVDKIINGVQVFPDALGSPVATPAA
jgi:hypothetical protein